MDDHAAEAGEEEVEDDEIGRSLVDPHQRFQAIAGFDHVVAGQCERRAEQTPQIVVVLHDEDRLPVGHLI